MLLLALVGLLSRQVTLQGMIDHASLHWDVLGLALGFVSAFRIPLATTLSRLLARVSPDLLQTAFAPWLAQLVAEVVEEANVDGKYPHQYRDEQGNSY
ncbi:MAG: hypothetical protein OHK0052_09420 [Anaerolineales bacterium]